MNRVFCFFIFLFLSFLASAQNELNDYFFCTKKGMTLEFTRTISNGDIKWKNIMHIKDVYYRDGEGFVDYTSMMIKGNGKKRFDNPILMRVDLKGDEVIMDMGKSVSDMLKELLPGFLTKKMRYKGGISVFPSDLQLGDTLADLYCVITIMGIDGTVKMDDRKVLGFEKLTTDEGVFDCIKISEHKVERGTPKNRETVGISWYAKGMGIIRHDTYNMDGERLSVEVLTKISR